MNRRRELAMLDEWWQRPGPQLGVIWGHRRVGKSYLVSHWARDRRVIFHIARNQPAREQFRHLLERARKLVSAGHRDLTAADIFGTAGRRHEAVRDDEKQ